MHIYVHTKYTMNAGKIINRDIMLWHDEREKSNFAYLYKHDFMFEKFNPGTTHSYEISYFCRYQISNE